MSRNGPDSSKLTTNPSIGRVRYTRNAARGIFLERRVSALPRARALEGDVLYSRRMLRSVSTAMRCTTAPTLQVTFSRRNDQRGSSSPMVGGGISAMATIRSRLASSNLPRPAGTDFWVQLLKAKVVEGMNDSPNGRLVGLADQRDLVHGKHPSPAHLWFLGGAPATCVLCIAFLKDSFELFADVATHTRCTYSGTDVEAVAPHDGRVARGHRLRGVKSLLAHRPFSRVGEVARAREEDASIEHGQDPLQRHSDVGAPSAVHHKLLVTNQLHASNALTVMVVHIHIGTDTVSPHRGRTATGGPNASAGRS